jgi:seryl-tRNA synthetase
MHDIKLVRTDPAGFDAALARRGVVSAASGLVAADAQLRAVQTQLQAALAQRNEASREIGMAKARRDNAAADTLMATVAALKERIPALEADERHGQAALAELAAALPNMPAADVPDGTDETGNVVIKTVGRKPDFGFLPLEHDVVAARLGYDPEAAAAIAGARFAVLKGGIARLHRALGQYMLDVQTEKNGYSETIVPYVVRASAVFGTGQLPKFEDDLFKVPRKNTINSMPIEWVEKQKDLVWPISIFQLPILFDRYEKEEKSDLDISYLIPTAEVPLTNMVRESTLIDDNLPLRLTALTPCFRSEAGSAGRDTKGLIRQHQFEKVELVSICTTAQAAAEHDHMLASAEAILENLGLAYRRMLLCAGDMGFSARKTFDLEVWLPGQGAWREISSISDCGDFQGRRMNARWKVRGEKGTQGFVNTLNGSGLAVGRTLVAIIENYQQADGSVAIPAVLHPYMGGITVLTPP